MIRKIAFAVGLGLAFVSGSSLATEALVKKPPSLGSTLRAYGIIKPEALVSTGVETFGRATLVAPTAAAHPIVNAQPDQLTQSFQLQQSRFGLHVGEGGAVHGRVEIDFVDPSFSQSSPIQGTRLRLRLAYLEYQLAPGHTLMAGQNWDIFSPLNPTMMNMVAIAFLAGNSAFLRPQFSYQYKSGNLEFATAVGLQRQNNSNAFNRLEYGLIPSLAMRIAYRKGKLWAGASVIGSGERTAFPPADKYVPTFAGNLFVSLNASSRLALKAEAYAGQNSAALGLLTLGAGEKVMDAGGFLSATYKLSTHNALWVHVGGALVLNPDELGLGYVRAADNAPATRAGSGIEHNLQVRTTFVHSPAPGMEMYLEPFLFRTRHKLDPLDDPDDSQAVQLSYGTSVGTRLRF